MSRRGRRPGNDEEAARRAREVTRRAVRRLDILEWVIIAGGAGVSLGVGYAAAWVLEGLAGWPRRPTWVVASVLFFAIPGAITILRIRKDEQEDRSTHSNDDEETDVRR